MNATTSRVPTVLTYRVALLWGVNMQCLKSAHFVEEFQLEAAILRGTGCLAMVMNRPMMVSSLHDD
ncbi:MAG: hypothetical protein Q8L05_04275, partial [Actinomycetota bacterium]|nr:hypothetical protein [Actinomycetota bacterium]